MTSEPDPPSAAGSVEEQVAKANPPPAPKDKLEEDRRTAASERLQISVKLAKLIGYGALIAVLVQVVLADIAFFVYGFENDWKIPAGAISAWLAAIVIEVIGVVLVVAKDIFPGPPSAGPSRPLRRESRSGALRARRLRSMLAAAIVAAAATVGLAALAVWQISAGREQTKVATDAALAIARETRQAAERQWQPRVFAHAFGEPRHGDEDNVAPGEWACLIG